MEPIRLNKFISDTGTCSRREADKLIEQGRVMVNGKIPEVGTKVTVHDKIRIDGQTLEVNREAPVYIALNKPAGIITTTDLSQRDNIIRFVNYPERIFPIGRLDKDSEGLIFLTNDGDIVNKILRAGNRHEKEYLVTVDKTITPDFINKMSTGVGILGVQTKKCFVAQEGPNRFRIILTQGMNRQIRRMCEALGYEVITLQRTRIMNITLAKLPLGQWRNLTEEEIRVIQSMVSGSTKTEEGSVSRKKVSNPRTEAAPSGGRGSAPGVYRPVSKPGKSLQSGYKGMSGKREEQAAPEHKSARGSRGAVKGSLKSAPGKKSDFKGPAKGAAAHGKDFKAKPSAAGSRGAAKGTSGTRGGAKSRPAGASGRPAATGGAKRGSAPKGASKRSR
ncbi:23S rRNA pseudouridine(2604) synthase RluF [Pontibacter sp. 172403-2]|uniref:23S rRNA pseudouridine(2604) synthase RluF n=1 Tax=Pontibacter rufus TaxID=2791028 RepID=UPI0018B01517|nr:23S rRNA pseudouridine(2604) synthase RluF [Pontibacter sp. 172403-2]MBF9254344.1 23S rRNA pseudouridine(2604) synthase RluF [Pontibacter sp. 172403-2]